MVSSDDAFVSSASAAAFSTARSTPSSLLLSDDIVNKSDNQSPERESIQPTWRLGRANLSIGDKHKKEWSRRLALSK